MEQNKKESIITDNNPNKTNEILSLNNENFLKEIINENILLKGKVSEKDTENINLKSSIFTSQEKNESLLQENTILKNEDK